MAVSKKSLENLDKGKKFSSDNQPENPGRKPSALSRYIKDGGVSITDIQLMLGSFIFDHTTKEIAALLKDKENPPPIGVSIILAALNEDLTNKNLGNLEKLLDRAYGKPTQKVDGSLSIRDDELLKELQGKVKAMNEPEKPEPIH
ncbi:hypothetical protein FACS1894151_08200 [Spirochaetia bacterium]|nr:hypothetical protein FACS1894151_08200 [Spirochaetia bacterium]